MKSLRRAGARLAQGACLPALLAWSACSSHEGGTQPDANASDASDASPVDATPDLSAQEGGGSTSSPDAAAIHCLLDDQTDPVALCTQKEVLRALHNAAYRPMTGVAASWDSATGQPDTDDAGAVLHDWHDDVGYAAAIALYLSSAGLYGDTEITGILTSDLTTIAPAIELQLATPPDEYTGETYLRLRRAAGGLRFENDTADGDKLDATAEAYARAIAATYFAPLASAAVADDAAANEGADATLADAAALPPDGIIGRSQGGAVAYVTADVATAALALLDLAVRLPADAAQASWQLAAGGALDHIVRRARDSATGLYYRALVTSNDPGHDRLDTSQGTADALLTGVTATVALALSRAQELADANPASLSLVAAYPFSDRVADALAAINGQPSLYDGASGDAAAVATGFMEGYVPSTQTLITTKATRDNAYLLAALHRQRIMVSTRWDTEILPMTRTLIQPQPPQSGLFSVVPNQDAYLRAATQSFGVIAGEPHAGSYQSAAAVAFVEGMTELLFGRR